MPEGSRRTPVKVTVEYDEYSENNVNGYRIYTFYLLGSNFRELPLDANVRLPVDTSIPYKEMVKTLETNPEYFFLQNSGISVIASGVKVNKGAKKVEFDFQPETGIVNGGHTQLAILNVKGQRDISAARIKVEVLEHNFTAHELAIIAASRNTASNVKPYSTAEKKGLFLKLKNVMLPAFEKHIIWYENRPVPNDIGLSAIDLIAMLNLFNVKKHQSQYNSVSSDQPNKSATSKSAVFKEWEADPDAFLHTYPLINDIINLLEEIESTFDKGIPKGFTTLSVIKNVKDKGRTTTFLGKELRFELPQQFLLPILASLRSSVKYDENNGKIGWYEKPEEVFRKAKVSLLLDLSKTYRTTYHNEINRASKDSNLWRILYLNAKNHTDLTKEWKMYDIPK